MEELPKADRRYKVGRIAKDRTGSYRGHPDTVELKRMPVFAWMPPEYQLSPPLIATDEMTKWLTTHSKNITKKRGN